MKWLCVFMLAHIAAFSHARLNMAAFNIETLGVTKMGKPEVVDYLVKIITRYDLVVIQELRDASGEAIVDLLDAVNAYSVDQYDMILGSRAGRSSYKEQYVFMFKPDSLKITGYYEYMEPSDEFEREPMIVRFSAVDGCAEQKVFAMMAIHAKPDNAVVEIDYLADVYDDVVSTWGIEDVAIVGDFNADCNYVGAKDWANIRLRTQSRFHWLIPDETDTTQSPNTNCAYDRLVVTGNLISTAHSPSVFYYDAFYGMTSSFAYKMQNKQLIYIGLLSLMICADVAVSLKVASFNIEVLGVTKVGKPYVVDILVKILARYDLIMVQEYRDKSQEAVVDLLDALNAHVGSTMYTYVMGARQGRTSSQEQVIYYFKPTKLTVTDAYDWDDKRDVFEREPYVVRFTSPTTIIKDFAIVNIHVKPDDAVAECDYLTDVYDDAVSKYGTTNVIVTGDLNADCTYVRDDDWANIRLRSQTRFIWLTPDDADTTVNTNTHCAYDRWVVNDNMKNIITGIGVFYFDAYYGLDYETADDVSDHYPIEMTIN
ncbi:uncharacterized protein [Amphiura filiformis]|uniref:uncharacterized protein n=1 Tax=Amphiura filiformis TaxID=82378 RepID=UPI003B211AF0